MKDIFQWRVMFRYIPGDRLGEVKTALRAIAHFHQILDIRMQFFLRGGSHLLDRSDIEV